LSQGDALELLDPEGKLAALFAEPEPEVVPPNIHRVRPAIVEDVPDMETVEQLAFPTLFPPTRFRREVERSNTLYLLAVRDWTEEEIALGPDGLRGKRRPGNLFRRIIGLPRLPLRMFYQTVGGQREKLPKEYVVGFVGLWFVMDETHIVIIGNRPGDRRKGIGELLLIAAVEDAMDRNARVVTLEVRSSNKVARALYHKYGFREVGVRKRYYADNNEDAVIMTTPPIHSDEYRDHFKEMSASHAGKWGESVRRVV
jgi:ribosomal-protein-alanine N-acetyltransferase